MKLRLSRPKSGLIHSLPSVVAQRWPALAVATVAAALPMGVALASFSEQGPAHFVAGAAGTDFETAVFAAGFHGFGLEATSFDNTALKATSGRLSNLALFAQGGGTGIQSEGTIVGLKATATRNDGSLTTGVEADGYTYGVHATARTYGVNGQGDKVGVAGHSGTGVGVTGDSTTGPGVRATSASNLGVDGTSSNGIGVGGTGHGEFGIGVLGAGDDVGVQGNGINVGVHAHGVNGAGLTADSVSGLGAEFAGKVAPLRLDPATAPGAPNTGTHHKGELYVDSNGDLFYCKSDSSSAAPAGVWKKLS